MENTPRHQRQQYRKSCTHYRKGHVVHLIDGEVEFTGKQKVGGKDAPAINLAKKYVRTNKIRSFTIAA